VSGTSVLYRRTAAFADRGLGAASARLARYCGIEGILARTLSTGSMVLWVAILLGAYLFLYYV
jgi:hypothetical protein